jgi:hypothetical protein
MAVGLAALGTNISWSGQNDETSPSSLFAVDSETHKASVDLQALLEVSSASQIPLQTEVEIPPPTRSSFMASWAAISGATGYRLDVATNDSFSNYVEGYHDLDVGNVTGRVVTGLNPGTTYYYRVRPITATARGSYCEAMAATTVPTTGLTIQATFDTSITINPNAAAIEAMINRAIAIYESLFSDPITIHILFRYGTTAPDGTPLPAGLLSQSNSVLYTIPWSTFINALRADARTPNDAVANASLPGTALSANIGAHSANGRAVGLNTPPAMFANGTVGTGGPYDGIVTLNSSYPFQFTRPTSAGNFDAQRSTEHEMDEVLGFASHADISHLRPQDLFSWSSAGHRNISSSGTRYFSINNGATNIVDFNQDPTRDFGDWLSPACPQQHPYVQDAFSCPGQFLDIAAISPEGVNLDVIGYDLNASGFLIPDTTRRGMVFDFAGQNLYFSTSNGLIKTLRLSAGAFGTTYNLGGSLNGIDISRDNSFLLVAQNNYGPSQGTVQRVNLANGAITNIHYTRAYAQEGGAWDVAIAANGLALVTTQGTVGSSWTPLRQIDLSTNATTVRADAPGSGFDHQLSTDTQIHRSADGTRLFIMEGDDFRGPVFTYSALTNTFGPSFHMNAYLASASGAVNRNGNLMGLRTYGTPASLRVMPDYSFVHSFNGIDAGLAFDAVRDIFYGVNSATDEIVAYSTVTYRELFRVQIGEHVGRYTYEFDTGTLAPSPDGRWLALETYSGIRLFKVPHAPPPPATGVPDDFNNDGHADYLLYNSSTRQTMALLLHNNLFFGSTPGPTLPSGWQVIAAADFNRDGHPDYLLFNPATRQTAIQYLLGLTIVGSNPGPMLPSGWQLVTTGDFNGDGYPDLVLYSPGTRATVVWYMQNNMHVGSSPGPTLPVGWRLAGVADFNGDGKPDYLLYNTSTHATVIWYLTGVTHTSGRLGPAIPAGYDLLGQADFNGDGHPDYLLFNPTSLATVIWYMNNNVHIGGAYGPSLPGGWSLVAP